ncbi:hypothetical protein [Arthrobacter sp. A2-55]|uniref:hypothetical protein n=1 Tax=Arthrobacter sp. A2-55 TaxID=2897337 RepID=UPI0021CDDBCB|nr:hypothetical protein [Arthrobacter sp. A2-55]MCU6481124.1 hypothetical protein [Arthrobacter sp. A2-55]
MSIGVPSQAPQAGGATQAAPAPSASAPTATNSAGPGSSATPSAAGPTMEPTAAVWKIYTDPGKNISFELPQDWTTQLVPGTNPAALHVEVRDQDGTLTATLQTHITGLGGACQPGAMRRYTVLSSIPLAIPSTSTGTTTVDPRFVYRLIQGATHFYASYGITDRAGGQDGRACLVYNTVTSDKLGIYMFGDVLQFTSAPDGSPGLQAFTTITEAQAHMRSTSYRNVERMVTSLKVLG